MDSFGGKKRVKYPFLDFFGNATASVAWHEPVEKITFCLTAKAERFAPPPADLSPPLGDLPGLVMAACDLGPAAPQHYLAPSPRIAPDAAQRFKGFRPQREPHALLRRRTVGATHRAGNDPKTRPTTTKNIAAMRTAFEVHIPALIGGHTQTEKTR